MIKILARCVIKTECIEEFKKATEELVKCSQAEEGNISYTLNQDIKNENVFCYIEEWKDMAAIEHHNNTEHFIRIGKITDEFKEAPTEVSLYTEVEF